MQRRGGAVVLRYMEQGVLSGSPSPPGTRPGGSGNRPQRSRSAAETGRTAEPHRTSGPGRLTRWVAMSPAPPCQPTTAPTYVDGSRELPRREEGKGGLHRTAVATAGPVPSPQNRARHRLCSGAFSRAVRGVAPPKGRSPEPAREHRRRTSPGRHGDQVSHPISVHCSVFKQPALPSSPFHGALRAYVPFGPHGRCGTCITGPASCFRQVAQRAWRGSAPELLGAPSASMQVRGVVYPVRGQLEFIWLPSRGP